MAKKKPIKKEIIEERKEYDMICPIHLIDEYFFKDNVESWIEEIPTNRILVGCNNPSERYFEKIKTILLQYDKIEFIDQRGIKTLGMQIVDLMKRCDTEWFVYVHSDVFLTRHSFLVLEAEIDTKDENDDRPVGIIESERVSYDYKSNKDYPRIYSYYHYRDRSFSGYQLIRKEAIANILDKIEDDYVYRNEDFIFQNVCENNGFRYVKSFGMHIHTSSSVNHQWTPQGKETPDARSITFDMQIKGLVKYCTPTEITKVAWRDGFGQCIRTMVFKNIEEFLEFKEDFVRKENPEWEIVINEIFFDLIKGIYQ